VQRSGRLVAGAVFVASAAGLTAAAIAVAPGPEERPRVAIGGLGTTSTTTTPLPPATPVPLAPGPLAPILSRIDTTNPVVFLTIDDGLIQDERVVRWLEQHEVPVTLFPTVPFVDENPAYFEAIHALGASVQDHTVNHKNLTNLNATEQHREICNVLPEFAARFGQTPWMLRPPGGAVNSSVQYAARTCGIRAIVLWRATMNDGRLDTQGGSLQRGDIVLMHFRHDLLDNLKVVLAAAEAQGLRPARLEDYLTPG
jgi:peptidoglycan/xylan/chitin deacetylase (PgdA/CDA1 family)